MLNELLLTTTLCVAIVGAMALFYGELELLLADLCSSLVTVATALCVSLTTALPFLCPLSPCRYGDEYQVRYRKSELALRNLV